MKRDTFHELIFPVLLSAAIAFCAIGCLITAFGLTVESHLLLALLLVLLALIYTLLPQWRFGPALFAAALIGVILYFHEPLLLSLEKLLYTISSVYDQHLRCGCIRWSDADLSAVSCLPILLPIGLLLIMPIIWTLRFQGFFVFALIPGLVPLLPCCIVKDTVPDLAYLIALATLLLLILLTQLTRRVSHGAATRLTALLLIPALLFASVSLGSAAADPHTQQADRLYARITAFFSRQEGNNGSGPGRTDPQVDLTAVGPKKPSDAPAMTVQANHTGILYLRGQAYTHYTGHSWYTPYTTPDGGGWPTDGMVEKGPVSIIATTQTIRYTPYYVRDEDWTDRLQGGAFRNPNRKTVYTFQWMAPDSSRETVGEETFRIFAICCWVLFSL